MTYALSHTQYYLELYLLCLIFSYLVIDNYISSYAFAPDSVKTFNSHYSSNQFEINEEWESKPTLDTDSHKVNIMYFKEKAVKNVCSY